MSFESSEKYSSVDEFIEKRLTPELKENYQVFRHKKVGEQYFFLVQRHDDPNTKFVIGYEITKAASGRNGITVDYAFLGDSLKNWKNLFKCPNCLLSRIERNIEQHEAFISYCLQHQNNIEIDLKLRPEKYALFVKIDQRTIIKNKSGEKVRFMGLHTTKRDKLWGIYLSKKEKVLLSLDEFDLEEVKKTSKKIAKEKIES